MADEKELNAEERYRYIGFEVFGKKSKEFWQSEEEKKRYQDRLKETADMVHRISVVYSSALSKVDRLIITIASVVMILAPFLPWMSAETRYGGVSFTGIFGLFQMGGFWFYVQKMGGSVIPLTVYLTALLAYLSLVFGAGTLFYLFRKAKSEDEYLAGLKKIMRLQVFPCLIFIFVIILGLIGQRIPFGEYLGVYDLGGRYSIVTFVSFSSIGLWLTLTGFLLNFNKSREF